jgi:hypothetical protein
MRTAYVRWQAVLDAFRSSRSPTAPAQQAGEPPPALPSSRSQPEAAATARRDDRGGPRA